MQRFKPGDIVKCKFHQDSLTKDKPYAVISSQGNTINILTDSNIIDWFFAVSFKYDVEANRNKTIEDILK